MNENIVIHLGEDSGALTNDQENDEYFEERKKLREEILSLDKSKEELNQMCIDSLITHIGSLGIQVELFNTEVYDGELLVMSKDIVIRQICRVIDRFKNLPDDPSRVDAKGKKLSSWILTQELMSLSEKINTLLFFLSHVESAFIPSQTIKTLYEMIDSSEDFIRHEGGEALYHAIWFDRKNKKIGSVFFKIRITC